VVLFGGEVVYCCCEVVDVVEYFDDDVFDV